MKQATIEKAADHVRLVRELEGKKCFCGARKAPMQTFCSSDYFALPKALREALYSRIGEGYEEAYAEARNYLSASASKTKEA
jgi:hypothetical protein